MMNGFRSVPLSANAVGARAGPKPELTGAVHPPIHTDNSIVNTCMFILEAITNNI